MNIASTVTVAVLAKPDTSSAGPTPVHGSSRTTATIVPSAVMSMTPPSEMNSVSTTPMIPNTTSMSTVKAGAA